MSGDDYFDKIVAEFMPHLESEPKTEWPRLLKLLVKEVERDTRHEAYHMVHDCANAIFNMRRKP